MLTFAPHEEEESEEEEFEEEDDEEDDEEADEEEYFQEQQQQHQSPPRSSGGVKNLTSMWNQTAEADEPNTSTAWKRARDGTFKKSIQPKAMTKKDQRERDQMIGKKPGTKGVGTEKKLGWAKCPWILLNFNFSVNF